MSARPRRRRARAHSDRGETAQTAIGGCPYRIERTGAAPGAAADRYRQYDAERLDRANTKVGSFRILTHTDRVLLVAAEDGLLPAAAVRLAAFVQWDVQFHATYQSHPADANPRPFGPRSPRPELRFLRLPFRF